MDFFWIVIVIIAIFFYFNNRVARAEKRVDELERRLGTQATPTSEAVARPLSQEELAKAGVHAGTMFQRAYEGEIVAKEEPVAAPAPAPQPAPMPMYSETKETTEKAKFADETQEETSARWLGRIGAVAVLIGMSFFLKYAFDNNWIGPTGRVALGIIAGLATIGVGQKLRAKYLNYSDMLSGVGIAILYLSIYASYSFYHLVDPSVAFVLMGLVTTFGLVLAIAGSTLSLAVLATLGGFMTPVLLSTGENHLVALSVYMIILDLGVFGVAWFKKWTQLNYLSFVGTLILFGGWIEKFYTPPQMGETFLFVTIFFAIFLLTSLLHHILRKEPTTPSDLMLLVLNAAGYFAVSAWLLDPTYHELLGFFALILAVLYLCLTYVAFASNKSDRTLNLFLPGIAVVFLTIAIPLQLDGYAVSLSWLVESIVLIATGLYLRERVIQAFGWIVLMVGMLSLGQDVEQIRTCADGMTHLKVRGAIPEDVYVCNVTPFWNMGFFLMMVAITVFYGITALYYRFRDDESEWQKVALFALVMANIVTLWAFSSELSLEHRYYVSLVWFIESIVLLFIGLKAKNRIVEIIGWLGLLGGLSLMWDGVMGIRSGVPQVYGISPQTAPTLPMPFFNSGFFLMACSVVTFYAFVAMYMKFKEQVPDWKKSVGVILVLANILTIAVITSEIEFNYDQEIQSLYSADAKTQQVYNNYMGGYQDPNRMNAPTVASFEKISSLESSKNTAVSIFWALYAILLIAIGFMKRLRFIRLFGLVFFFVTAGRVFLEVWQLGQLERIISSIVFGVIALGASFLYVKYKHLLKSVVSDD